jgi:ABC transporter substrate binding protein
VFQIGGDPVEFGLVASLAHPGGNITGLAMLEAPVVTKRLDLLHQLIPTAATIALLITQQIHLDRLNAGRLKPRRDLCGWSCMSLRLNIKMKLMLYFRTWSP